MIPHFKTSCGVLLAGLVGLLSGCGGGSSTYDAGPCEAGTEGCGCAAQDRCSTNARGEQLVCQGGLCEAMSCSAGNVGCVCRGGGLCNDSNSTCTGGFCVAAGCAPGQSGCTCLAGGCDLGLTCVEGKVCVDSKGYEGGACLDSAHCYRGNRCDSSTGLCIHCDPGTAGCSCNASNACNAGLACTDGLCLGAAQLPPPNPTCYTHCVGDLTQVDGGRQSCPPDGLLPGCLTGQTCTRGSCLEPGQTKPSCASDLECPSWQVCLQGGCYSNCDVNADCSTGLTCFHHTCRKSCTMTEQGSCATGTACTTDDGQNGYCMPVGHSAPTSTSLPSGGLSVPRPVLDFSNTKTTDSFVLVPSATGVQDITVRKLWHSTTSAAGVVERVDAPLDGNGKYRACDPVKGECPLSWLTLTAPGGTADQSPTIAFRLLPGCVDATNGADGGTACPSIVIGGAGNTTAVKWQGELEVTSRDASVRVQLSYVQRPDGQWTGEMYYFGTFSDIGLDGWKTNPDKSVVANVSNGLLQRWGALRTGHIDGWQEFVAVLTSTREGSWSYANVQKKCPALGQADAVCYPYSNAAGVRTYVQNPDQYPIPTGVTELPVAMNLRINPNRPDVFEGRIASTTTMHYPGNPGVKVQFVGDPSKNATCFNGGGTDCIVFLKDLTAVGAGINQLKSTVGGRYASNGSCAQGYVAKDVPWLVPGFTEGTHPFKNGLARTECRDGELPFDSTAAAANAALNQSLSGGNPVPDGFPRERTLTFLDGALINQSQLFLFFEESYSSFIPGREATKAYGYMLLKRSPANLKATDFEALKVPTTVTKTPPIASGATCDATLLSAMFDGTVPADKRQQIARLLKGTGASANFSPIANNAGIHSYCEDTGLFNGGPGDDGSLGSVKVPCPAGSKVLYFNVCSAQGACSKTPADLAHDSCQTTYTPDPEQRTCTTNAECRSGQCSNRMCVRASCQSRLTAWKTVSTSQPVVYEGGADGESLYYECSNPGQVYCDDDRADVRAGKQFFRKNAPSARSFVALQQLIETAFRYKTRFRSSVSGSALGFAPQQCVPGSDAVPYCYDPAQITEARKRIDCLVNIYDDQTFIDSLGSADPLRATLFTFLQQNFSDQGNNRDGFERLYAELNIMLGDEALTAAYASRFDLAAAGGATFPGSTLEADGIDLTGVAGAEMFNLYQSVQYYQLALDRLYRFGPNMKTALARGAVGADPNFVTTKTVTSYLERLVRAASQKSRAWGEIAKRYQNFNRPDLARRVIERAYVATYLESALISRLMLDITTQSAAASLPQLRLSLATTQRNYRMALLDMRGVYQQITDQVNFFGFAPDYIPFPALDAASVSSANAYEVLSLLAKQRLDLAKTREQIALTFGKQGKVDAAQFQSDLTSIRNNYENQLSSICGTFIADDGRAYPAIKKYAPLASAPTLVADPCGHFGNGELHDAMANVKDSVLKMQGVLLRQSNLFKDIAIERKRAAEQCKLTVDLANFQYVKAGQVADMQLEIDGIRAQAAFASGAANAAMQALAAANCENTGCVAAAVSAVSIGTIGAIAAGDQLASDVIIATKERDLKDYERESVRIATLTQCEATKVDSTANVARLFNETLETQLEALRAEYSVRVALADVQKLANNAARLEAQQQETEQLAVDVQAAQNDPNVRIYQNDAVINADVSFNAALATAYRLTRVYEYYTSQTYAKKEQLFLIRMVTAGQYNLENYLLELDNSFNMFEEQFGNPDLRVLTMSLRDDILKIPYVKSDRTPYTEAERIDLMREKLRDVRLLDSSGYLTIPFSTSLKALSPVTRNHKIRHVEVDLQGVKMGDAVARVYLRMSGTGLVRNVKDDIDYYVFPSRLAVLNASLLGSKVFDPEVYRNYRFRDRPLVNTMWELVINQRDEAANQDVDLQTLTDLRLIIYYSDVTSF